MTDPELLRLDEAPRRFPWLTARHLRDLVRRGDVAGYRLAGKLWVDADDVRRYRDAHRLAS